MLLSFLLKLKNPIKLINKLVKINKNLFPFITYIKSPKELYAINYKLLFNIKIYIRLD